MTPDDGIQPQSDSVTASLAAAERSLVEYLAVLAIGVCDRWDADEVDDDAMSNDITRLRRIAEAARVR